MKPYVEVKPINSLTLDNIVRALSSLAADTILRLAPAMDGEEIYKNLILPEMFDTMCAASKLMPKTNYSISFSVFTKIHDKLAINIHYNLVSFTGPHTEWLWPCVLHNITPESELGEQVIPIVQLAMRWKTTIELVNLMFKTHKPAIVMHMMPWLNNFITNIMDKSTNYSDYVRLLECSRPRNVPGVSRWFSTILADGGALIAQHTLIKDIKRLLKENEAIIVPILRDNLVNPHLKDQFNNFTIACNAMDIATLIPPKINGEY